MRISILIFILALSIINLAQADELGDLGALVVEASRSNDTVGNMNKDVTIITSDDIANSPSKNLPELLSAVPGVDARVNSSIKDQQIDMGGFGEASPSNVVVLVDGRRLNKPDFSPPDLSLIDLNTVDHIEIIQGASTVLYGDNATGGVINIITKKGTKNTKPSITLSSEVDSYKGNKDGFSLSGGFPKLAYQFNYDRQQSNNYRTDNNYWANDYDTRLNYNPTDIFGVDFAQGFHLDRYRQPGGINIDTINSGGPTGVNPGSISYGTTSDSHFDVTPHIKFDVGASNADLSLFSSARKSVTNVVYPNFPESLNFETESYEFQPKLIFSTPFTDRLDNKLTTGYDYIYYTEKRRINTSGEDIVFAREASQSVYLLDELTLDNRWLFNTGIRGAWAEYVFNQTQQSSAKFDRSPTAEGFEGGIGYKYNPNSKIFVNYTRSYRLPDLDEFFQSPYQTILQDNPALVNPGLSYQVGNQYQLGIKDKSFKDINLGFTGTAAQYKNEIFFDPSAPPYGANSNYGGRTRHFSEEVDISVEMFNKKIEPFTNITFQQTEFIKGNYSGNQIPDVPDHLAHAGITYRPLERLSTTIETTFVGKRFGTGDDANIYPKVKRYDTVDWSAKYGFKNIEVWVNLNNIFNTRYFVYGSSYDAANNDEVYYPAPGRNIAAGIKVKF